MRLWSLHPKYLDPKGLVALWREALLAQHVLMDKTKGYKHHPQLIRFKSTNDPLHAIGAYLLHVQQEAANRGYHFNAQKIQHAKPYPAPINVTDAQLLFEFSHLRTKLHQRDPEKYASLQGIILPDTHPLFVVSAGPIATWERP